MLLGGRAVHPLEGRVLHEDGQCSEDEGCKQVQVDVVPGAVQVSGRESRALPWQDGPQCCSTASVLRLAPSQARVWLWDCAPVSLPLSMPSFPITLKILLFHSSPASPQSLPLCGH